jgi:hypothetical protein
VNFLSPIEQNKMPISTTNTSNRDGCNFNAPNDWCILLCTAAAAVDACDTLQQLQ